MVKSAAVSLKNVFKRHPHILTFGVLQIFFTAPGQTFLISLFVTEIFSEFGVSQSYFAGIYSAATLSASLLLNPAGHLIDKYPIRWHSVAGFSPGPRPYPLSSLVFFCCV